MRDSGEVFHLPADLTITPLRMAKSKMPGKSAIQGSQAAGLDDDDVRRLGLLSV